MLRSEVEPIFYKNHPCAPISVHATMANSMGMSGPQDICYVPYQGLSYGYCVKLTPEQLQQEKAMAAAKRKSQTTLSTTTTRKAKDKQKNRTRFNEDQLLRLEREYKSDSYPDRKRLAKIANDLLLEERILKMWFANKRNKDRKKERSCRSKEFPVFPKYTPLTPTSSRSSVSSSASETDFKLISPSHSSSMLFNLLHKAKKEPMSAKSGTPQCNVDAGMHVPCNENYLAHYDSKYDHFGFAPNKPAVQYAAYDNSWSAPNQPADHYLEYDNFWSAQNQPENHYTEYDTIWSATNLPVYHYSEYNNFQSAPNQPETHYTECNNFWSAANQPADHYSEYDNFQTTGNPSTKCDVKYNNFQIARDILSSDFKLIDKLTPDEITYLERTT